MLRALLYPLPAWLSFGFLIYISFTYISYSGMWECAVLTIAAPDVILGGIIVDTWPDR